MPDEHTQALIAACAEQDAAMRTLCDELVQAEERRERYEATPGTLNDEGPAEASPKPNH